jgi:cytochrome c-type biogenesis protein CcmF
LGWGGYWGWDPVENAGLLPWFTATAFLHSVRVQEQRGMLRVWNVTLVIVTFFLTIFGTFMTRSGVVQSVHAFGEDRELALLFTIFMVLILVFSFGWVIYRLPLLRARNELDSWVSREAAFLVNNWILLFSAFFVLFATMFPTLSEAVTGERLTVAAPFFNRWMLPIGLILLTLTGVGPLLAWRKSTTANLLYQFRWPVLAFVVTAGALFAAGIRVWSSGLCFALCAMVLTTIGQEFVRGAEVRRAATGSDLITSLIGLVGRSKRRYGGYIVHVGIVLIFLGFAGEGFRQEEQALMKPGQQLTVGPFSIRHDALRVTEDAQKQMITGHVTVFEDGEIVGTMEPARWFFRKKEDEPTTEVAIRRGLGEDLYVVLAGYDAAAQSATYTVTINPLVNWIWLGFGIMALGTIIALLPDSAFAFAASRVPAGAAGATTALLIVALLLPAVAHAQHAETPDSAKTTAARTPLEKELWREIICMCGGCGRKRIGDFCCAKAASMRAEVSRLLDAGKTREEVYQYFIAQYGSQEPLGSPIDKGFNRLAWFFPYLVGASGAVAVAFVAMRWSKKHGAADTDEAPAEDPALRSRLDDELRDLD